MATIASTISLDNTWLNKPEELKEFRTSLISWGINHFRSFPWRMTHDAYAILMAEIMLHRTQVKQVVPIYINFIHKFPNITTLSQANIDEISNSLASLGLTWRIGLIEHMVSEIEERFEGNVPQVKEALLSLPGISEYIAGAIRCFAWGYSEGIVDTNTVRITSRLFGLETKDSSRRNRTFIKIINILVDPSNARAYNYALLDLAHLICHKKQLPECSICPVLKFCNFGQTTLK
jgi:A/G-specific adenine glycosylase